MLEFGGGIRPFPLLSCHVLINLILVYIFDLEQEFDAVAGDVTITEKRHKFVDFTQLYTESGLEMIVSVRSRLSNQPLLLLKPFTA
ncbi:putative solute-binding protein family 3/ domain of MltF [Helianthus anomalus]